MLLQRHEDILTNLNLTKCAWDLRASAQGFRGNWGKSRLGGGLEETKGNDEETPLAKPSLKWLKNVSYLLLLLQGIYHWTCVCVCFCFSRKDLEDRTIKTQGNAFSGCGKNKDTERETKPRSHWKSPLSTGFEGPYLWVCVGQSPK